MQLLVKQLYSLSDVVNKNLNELNLITQIMLLQEIFTSSICFP